MTQYELQTDILLLWDLHKEVEKSCFIMNLDYIKKKKEEWRKKYLTA